MSVNFPSVLQEYLDEQGFTFEIGSTTIRSSNDVGPDKIRRRFTKSVDTQSSSITIKYDQYQILYDFYNTTLAGGSLTFLYKDQFTSIEEEYRFVSPPRIAPLGGEFFRVTMNWEKMP